MTRPSPRWPRSLRSRDAAQYAGYKSERDFLLAVNEGTMPPPFFIGGADAWDIQDLDASIDAIKAGGKALGSWERDTAERVRLRRERKVANG